MALKWCNELQFTLLQIETITSLVKKLLIKETHLNVYNEYKSRYKHLEVANPLSLLETYTANFINTSFDEFENGGILKFKVRFVI